MQSLATQPELALQGRSPTRFDEFKIAGFVRSVDFVTYDGIASERKVDPNLVGPAGFRLGFNHRETSLLPGKLAQNFELSNRGIALRVYSLFQPDPGRADKPLWKQRLIDREQLSFRPTCYDRGVALAYLVSFHQPVQLASCPAIFGHQHESARFAVKTIDERDLAAVYKLKGQELLQFVP